MEARTTPQLNLYDRVFVRVDPARGLRGRPAALSARGARDPPRGPRVYLPTGVGTVAAMDDGTATVVIVGMFDQVRHGRRGHPAGGVSHPHPGQPAPPWTPTCRAASWRFRDDTPLQRTESIVFLDIGRSAGVGVGDEFEVYDPPPSARWGTRPEISVARRQVVKVTEGTASVRVTQLDQPRIAVGLPVRRVARMP